MNIKASIALLCLIAVMASAADTPAATTTTTSSTTAIDTVTGFPEADILLNQYVRARKPLLIRQAHKSPANNKWTDSYLLSNFAELLVAVQPNNTAAAFSDTSSVVLVNIKDFINKNVESGVTDQTAILSQIPQPMSADILLPKALNCPPFNEALIEADLWLTSTVAGDGDRFTYSSLRDYPNTLLCQVRATRSWAVLDSTVFRQIDPQQELPDVPENLFNADSHMYPVLNQIARYEFETQPGDCVYLPGGYFYQANRTSSSTDRSVSFSLSLSGPTSSFSDVKLADVNQELCAKSTQDIALNQAHVAWTYSGQGVQDLTMGWDDPQLIRNLWADMSKNGKDGQLNLEDFKKALENEVKELAPDAVYDQQRNDTVLLAEEKFFKALAGEKGHLTAADVENADRNVIIGGLRGYFHLLHIYYTRTLNFDAMNFAELDTDLTEDFDHEHESDGDMFGGSDGSHDDHMPMDNGDAEHEDDTHDMDAEHLSDDDVINDQHAHEATEQPAQPTDLKQDL